MTEARIQLGAWYRIDLVVDDRIGPRYFRVRRLWPPIYQGAAGSRMHAAYRAKTRRRRVRRG